MLLDRTTLSTALERDWKQHKDTCPVCSGLKGRRNDTQLDNRRRVARVSVGAAHDAG